MIAKVSTAESFFLGLILVGIDRFFKEIFSDRDMVCNTGISFGIPVSEDVFTPIAILIMIATSVFLKKHFVLGNKLAFFGGLLLLFGGLSNIADRILYGCVRDYIYVFSWFPWFNIADVLVFLGGLCIFLALFWESEKDFRKILS